jgi:proline iminopeptidase
MLASAYLGRHPEKIRKIVMAEPGMLTEKTADIFLEITQPRISWSLFWRVTKIWLQSLHVKGPDDQARPDFIYAQILSTPDPDDNPIAKYFCDEDLAGASFDYWRMGMAAFVSIPRSGMDEDGNLHLNLVEGVDRFKDKVLFLAGECNQLIGADHQRKHLEYFPNSELIVIPECGHNMFSEKPLESMAIVRSYFQ